MCEDEFLVVLKLIFSLVIDGLRDDDDVFRDEDRVILFGILIGDFDTLFGLEWIRGAPDVVPAFKPWDVNKFLIRRMVDAILLFWSASPFIDDLWVIDLIDDLEGVILLVF